MTPKEEEQLLRQNSKTLAVTIITNRVLGCYREQAKKCMMVLMQRRLSGDKFEFEKFIEDGVKEYNVDVNTNLLSDLRKQIAISLAGDITKAIKN